MLHYINLKMTGQVSFFALLFLAVISVTLAWSDCGSVVGTLSDVQVNNCPPNARRCTLRRGSNATMTISFTPKEDSDTVKAVVHGVVMGAPVPFNLPNPNGCSESGIECPVKSGNVYKYFTNMPVLTSYPRMTVDIKWELQDSAGKNIICAMIPAKLQ
ncbi:ecdysteroid-regulated 16 kDa protein-like [Anthonomus grandis grandis]|uniref:ecdysteroid-regulated 16 kDa protein-like n=1 Tax=Anthonomus grandis grandis TaxID=2921223 RepID=UPI00216630F9|nr:ecdysteroid-regulated 16 kDa protein-like [Anthonomus grandis grandis]